MFKKTLLSLLLAVGLAGCAGGSALPDTPEIAALRGGFMPVGSTFGSTKGINGLNRIYPHEGMDFWGEFAIAPADGFVKQLFNGSECGLGVILYHPQHKVGRYTEHCHLERIANILPEQPVYRGDLLGKVGKTGSAVGIEHLHFELRETPWLNDENYIDPRPFLIGCFDPNKNYRAVDTGGIPLLTAPVDCGPSRSETAEKN